MTSEPALYDPANASSQQDPFPAYANLRRDAPVYRHPETGVYFVSRHATVRRILADPATFSSRLSNAATLPSRPELLRELARIAANAWLPPARTLVTADPPEHTRYRKIVAPLLSPSRVRELEEAIRSLVVELLDAWPASGHVDFKRDFALRLPVLVTAHVLGVDRELEHDMRRWADDSVAAIGVDADDERRLEAMRGIVEMQRYWGAQIEAHRAQPSDGILDQLMAASFEVKGQPPRSLEIGELISVMVQLMVAGNEATSKFLTEMVKLLAQHPEEWKRICDEPARIPAVVEEGLRLASPNQGLYRHACKAVELEGVEIPEDSTLWVMFGSANRDERVFPDPDRFDPDRPNLRDHLAFGMGAHFCVGAGVARSEARIALEEMTQRFGQLRIAPEEPLHYEPSFILRGLADLRIELA